MKFINFSTTDSPNFLNKNCNNDYKTTDKLLVYKTNTRQTKT